MTSTFLKIKAIVRNLDMLDKGEQLIAKLMLVENKGDWKQGTWQHGTWPKSDWTQGTWNSETSRRRPLPSVRRVKE